MFKLEVKYFDLKFKKKIGGKMMNNLIISENEITNKIYNIRGVQVMLDSDLAELYKCANGSKTINQAVKRNIDKFPSDFYFQLTNSEYENLRFHFETSIIKGGRRYNPYVFTEQGVAMLATVLKTEVASKVSVAIMKAFVIMHKYISNNLIEQKNINNQVYINAENISKNTEDIKMLKESFDSFKENKKVNEIYYDGQIWDAYSKIQDIFKLAKNKLIIIDGYADNSVLDIIKRLDNIDVVIITKSNNLLTKQDIEKYNKQYHNLKVIFNNSFHDRYFILDDNTIYHCGSSINRIGYKTFCINILEDQFVTSCLLKQIKNIT